MNHKTQLNYVIFWSSLITVLVISHRTQGLLTDSNELPCWQVQCPSKCPEDSYLASALENGENDFDDYEDEFLGHHDPYIEEIGHFEEIPPELDVHDDSLPQPPPKERQRREAFVEEDIERCCEDQKCVCNKCPDVPQCAEDYVAVEVHEGHAVPGNCCSIFRCIKKEQCRWGVKQSWWTSKCRKCSCFGENELCEQICPEEEVLQSCYSEYWQKPMLNGVFWKEGSCTSCSCEQGERRCFTPVCPKLSCRESIKVEDECCPKCLHEATDDSLKIERNSKEQFEEEFAEDYATEVTTIDAVIVNENKGSTINLNHDQSNIPVVDENQPHETAAVTPKSKQLSTTWHILPDISTTLQPESVEDISTLESPTSASTASSSSASSSSSSSSSTLSPISKLFSSVITSTEDVLQTLYNTTSEETPTSATATATSKPDDEPDFSATESSEPEPVSTTSGTTFSENSHELSLIEGTTATEETDTNAELDEFKSSSTEEHAEETSTADATKGSTAATLSDSSSPKLADSVSEGDNTLATDGPLGVTPDVLSNSSPSVPSNTNLISTSAPSMRTIGSTPAHSNTSTTRPDISLAPANSIEQTTSAGASTEHPHQTPTSTTSSPYSTASHPPKATLNMDDTTSNSSTSAPEPLRPLFQSYGDMTSEEGSTNTNTNSNSNSNTQHQMRIIFDEIDYVVIIGLFVGSLLCISLGLIIRHTKNRKKMYSSVPNSETSLSQNSTNTVLTIPSYSDNGYSSSN